MPTLNSIGLKPLPITQGGTDDVTLTNNGILVGQGAGNILSIDAATDGDLFIGSSSGDPSWSSIISSDGSVTITPGVNTVELSAASTGGDVISWTPTITYSSSAAVNYITRIGTYVIVGKFIFWTCLLQVTVYAQGATATISGLPGNYNLNIPRYYSPMNGYIVQNPNVGPWPLGFCYLDTATGLINVITNEPSVNNALWVDQQPIANNKNYFASGFYFTN